MTSLRSVLVVLAIGVFFLHPVAAQPDSAPPPPSTDFHANSILPDEPKMFFVITQVEPAIADEMQPGVYTITHGDRTYRIEITDLTPPPLPDPDLLPPDPAPDPVPQPPNSDRLLAHYPLDETSGTAATDVSPNSNDGILVDNAQFSATTPNNSPSALSLDGAQASLHLPPMDTQSSEFSLTAWFNATTFTGPSRDGRIISKATGTSSNAHMFMLSTIAVGNQTHLRARLKTGNITTTIIDSTVPLQPDTWYHAALTYDAVAQRLKLYLDAIPVAMVEASGPVASESSVPIAVGSQPPGAGGKHFDGLIDDVRIYLRTLSQDEITVLSSFAN